MPAIKKTYILLTCYVACGFIGLAVLATRYRQVFSDTLMILFGVVFGLLMISGFIIAYNLHRRKAAEKVLQELEHRFGLLMQHVKDYAIIMVDTDGLVLSWNKGAEVIKGYKAVEIIGQPISVFYTDEDIEKGEPADNLKKAADNGSYESIGLRRRKDGSTFCADVVLTCLRNDEGEITGYVKITKDITDQMNAEHEIKLSLLREKELNEMKSRFVTLASHEFKTPLSVILSSTSLIAKYASTAEQDQRLRHVQRIKSNVKNLRQILNDFLSLEKLEEGVVRNKPVATDVVELARETIMDIEQSCQQGQNIDLEIQGDARWVMVDEMLLHNVLNNLLSNAVKYSPERSPVRFSLHFLPGAIQCMVADSGIGIPAGEQGHLFERFFRASNTGGIGGTGLGLSIVKRHLDLIGGRIEVCSEPGQGTCFTVTIPASNTTEPLLVGADPVPQHL